MEFAGFGVVGYLVVWVHGFEEGEFGAQAVLFGGHFGSCLMLLPSRLIGRRCSELCSALDCNIEMLEMESAMEEVTSAHGPTLM